MTKPGSNLGRVAIVGGGIAGLTAARVLAEAGASTTLFDKARKPGGRLSTKRSDRTTYDHGAQFFTARDPEFQAVVERLVAQGVVARWEARVVVLEGDSRMADPGTSPRFVGTPKMSSLAAALTQEAETAGVTVEARVRIGEIAHGDDGVWELTDVDGGSRGWFEHVIVGTPAGQAVPLLAGSPALARMAESVRMQPCVAAMVSFETPLDADFDAAFVNGSPAGWLARNSSKPHRPSGDSWVVHGAPGWSNEHFEDDPGRSAQALLEATAALLGPLPSVVERLSFRWRYALVDDVDWPDPYLLDADRRIGACGDWCVGGRVEGGFRSGLALARRMLTHRPES